MLSSKNFILKMLSIFPFQGSFNPFYEMFLFCFRKQMSLAMSQGTVESRVKAKINTIQRSKEAMSENFARRK